MNVYGGFRESLKTAQHGARNEKHDSAEAKASRMTPVESSELSAPLAKTNVPDDRREASADEAIDSNQITPDARRDIENGQADPASTVSATSESQSATAVAEPNVDGSATIVNVASASLDAVAINPQNTIASAVAASTDAVSSTALQVTISQNASRDESIRMSAGEGDGEFSKARGVSQPAGSERLNASIGTETVVGNLRTLAHERSDSEKSTQATGDGERPDENKPTAATAALSANNGQDKTDDAVADLVKQLNSNGNRETNAASKTAGNAQLDPQSNVDDGEHGPAIGRARQVESLIKLENVTGQSSHSNSLPNPDSRASHGHAGSPTARLFAVVPQPSTSSQPSATSHDDRDLQPQIVRGLATMLNQRGGVMTMRLDPPDLGEVRVQMTLHHGTVAAEFHASTSQAQALLDKNMAVLRHALEGQGLTVDRLSVHVSPTHQQSMRDDNANNANHGQSQQRFGHDAAGGESRGRHEQHSQQQHEPKWRMADFASLFESDEFAGFAGRMTQARASR